MPTEVFFRNPDLYVRELVEVGVKNLAFDIGFLRTRNIDPIRIVNSYYPRWMDYRMLVIGGSNQGAAEVTRSSSLERPARIHPVWQYGEHFDILEDLCRRDEDEYIILNNLPYAHRTPARSFYRALGDLQDEYPHAKLYIHGTYSFNLLFGRNFSYGDIEVRTRAASGHIYLPNGKDVAAEDCDKSSHWLNLLGYTPRDMKVPRNRCLYSIEAVLWASQYFQRDVRFIYKGKAVGRLDGADWQPESNNRIQTKKLPTLEGDKYLCDMCSLQDSCKFFRTGSVCIVPDAESVELSKFFKTRDSDTIIEGLGTLLATQTQRLQRGLKEEIVTDTINPEVTKIINSLFDRGVKLAKLVNPALAASGAARIILNQNNATINGATPQQLVASITAELEARGVPRENITPEMIESFFADPAEVKSRALQVGTGG